MELDELRRLAAKEEISLNFVAKDEMLSKVLFCLQGVGDIILKGGTAINRVYLRNKRFSEDIDFDLVFDGSVKQALLQTNAIVKKLVGFDVEGPHVMKDTIRYDLFYINPLNRKDRIRLEFKAVKKASNYGKRVVNFGFVPSDSSLLNVYDVEELILQKIECVLNRIEGKDFFDLCHLIALPHKRLRISTEKIIGRISLKEKGVKAAANVVNHYIPKGNRPFWSIFLEELKDKLRKY